VYIRAGSARETLEEVGHQLSLKISNESRTHLRIDSKGGPSTQINGGDSQRFIHWHEEVSGAQDTAFVAKSAIESFSQGDAHIFDCVMLIDIQVAIAFQLQIEGAMTRKQLKHVIEETDARADLVPAATLDRKLEGDARLRCVSLELSRPQGTAI
jgi:hypothetical protein